MTTATAPWLAFDRVRLARVADWLAIAVAVALPWSISIFQILFAIWLIALIPTLDLATIRRELRSAAGGIPVLLWFIGVIGMLWADISWEERFSGLGAFNKLLAIPLLLAQFRRSKRGLSVLFGFLASCVALLIVSAIGWVVDVHATDKPAGVPVRDYIAQSSEFLICVFALIGFALDRWRARAGIAVAAMILAALFLMDIFLIAIGRTALVTIAVLLIVLGTRRSGWRGVLAACAAGAVLAAVAWASSPLLRARVIASFSEVLPDAQASPSSGSVRLELWKESLGFIAHAPLIGHGTGSIPDQFRRGPSGGNVFGVPAVNPHNQVLAVAIQLGLIGTAILIAMWVAHLALFRGSGLTAWIGLVLVVQNIAAAPFNSHLFDSFHGWLYVFGVGVIGGMALRERQS